MEAHGPGPIVPSLHASPAQNQQSNLEKHSPHNESPRTDGLSGSGWIEIGIHIHPVAHEALCAFLFDLGCEGVVTADFEDHQIKAYLPFHEEIEGVRTRIETFLHRIEQIFPESGPAKITVGRIEDRDWGTAWRQFFRPQRITPRLTVLPAWMPETTSPGEWVLKMDPGPAFGTGQHPTTRLCLEAMERLCPQGSWKMLDVGTGSGILAIYGARLGAEAVLALDTDPEALRWAQRNMDLNRVTGSIELSLLPLETWTGTFSLITANLILETILDLLPFFPRLMDRGGSLVLSGLLKEQVPRVIEEIDRHPLGNVEVRSLEEWACITAERS